MPCSWLSGAVAERARDAVSAAYVLQDLLTTTDVRTRMAQLGARLIEPDRPAPTGHRGIPISRIWMTFILLRIQPLSAPIGGYLKSFMHNAWWAGVSAA